MYNETVWQPFFPEGRDFGILLDWDFAYRMVSSKISDEKIINAKFRIVHHIKKALIVSISMILLLYLSASNNDYKVCIKRQIVSYLLLRCTLHDVHLTPLGKENNIRKLKVKVKNAKLRNRCAIAFSIDFSTPVEMTEVSVLSIKSMRAALVTTLLGKITIFYHSKSVSVLSLVLKKKMAASITLAAIL